MPKRSTKSESKVEIPPIGLKELAELLVIKNNLHEGHYELAIEIKVAIGSVGPTRADALPGAMIGVSSFSLVRTDGSSDKSVDASVVNPMPVKSE